MQNPTTLSPVTAEAAALVLADAEADAVADTDAIVVS